MCTKQAYSNLKFLITDLWLGSDEEEIRALFNREMVMLHPTLYIRGYRLQLPLPLSMWAKNLNVVVAFLFVGRYAMPYESKCKNPRA